MLSFSSSCRSKARLDGKTAIVTGSNTGIGKETARDLYWRGARVILACRNLEKANEAKEDIRKTPPSKPDREQFQGDPGNLAVYKLDLCSLASVRECARELNANEPQIHLLINNAGVVCPKQTTEDGYDCVLQSNHLGHFLLTLLLLPKIRASGPGCRIVTVSSLAYTGGKIHFDDLNLEQSYTSFKAYAQSKLANIFFTTELIRKMKVAEIEGITTYSLHPGVITTDIGRHLDIAFFSGARHFYTVFKPFLKTPELGAQTSIHCVVDETAGNETGVYYRECRPSALTCRAKNKDNAAKLWTESLKLVGLPAQDDLAELLKTISNEILPKS